MYGPSLPELETGSSLRPVVGGENNLVLPLFFASSTEGKRLHSTEATLYLHQKSICDQAAGTHILRCGSGVATERYFMYPR
jgi:hypothetical protein